MKRRTTGLLAAALLAVLLLAGCGTRPLPSGMEEEAVGQAGQEYAVAVIYCEHVEKNIAYQLSFDTDLNLIGIYAEVKKK